MTQPSNAAAVQTLIVYSEEASEALASAKPVVALESTIITHGMPFPRNVETARQVEADIRAEGAVPATIAIMDGKLHVGLSDADLDRLAQAEDVMKCSRADMTFALATGRFGATTVAATMMAAHLAGVKVFATGGIGGVHKGAEETFDVSADLDELARTPVCVVSAGAKALLDIPKTLEVLETKGVPVIAYGTEELPAFWSRDSGLVAPYSLNSASEIGRLLNTRAKFTDHGGVLIANPVPEADEIPRDEMSGYIDAAIKKAEREKIRGKDVTPFVLGAILELTDGRSLDTNIALVRNNARLAAKIAAKLG
ncbi:pseudouridine-5'-phosphate glycosidase [Roseibium album]|uniref:Pseudouridine-5'-phosphate glycosidase n=1 Tax=Roseibium album TaxID=311410 RepID=A0A0M6ZR42_9HYPH|nr:pseudouridine-5'-phosphate glycosidase [Roseibium album]CTQ59339.1 Pseudouridine-5'-phosphate glycosidase [Roseibium album]CTQ64807.1 Pseudouridine-5'-phosphate glycosidase [Roseibium album]CTQ74723.1 Pseudouridine-5'-phosphate glycosidase [Roseibium album]